MSKTTILEMDNIRIRRWDKENVFVERLETYKGFNKEDKTDWRFKGYHSDVFKALQSINSKGLLIKEKAVSDVKSLLKQMKESEENIIQKNGGI